MNNRAIVLDDGLDAVLGIALDSGERTLLSDPSDSANGTGPILGMPTAIVSLDSARALMLVIGPRRPRSRRSSIW